ncbi:MAG: transcriptional regulator [Bacillota bacterium]|nr:MAG: transcriptional regulator [Bacillota bacterium]
MSKLQHLDNMRRNAIINAGLWEFASRQYDDASTNTIAREAGLSKPLLFHYINSKKDFFIYLLDYSLELLQSQYFDLIDYREHDLLERLQQTSLLKLRVMQQYPLIFDFIKVALLTDSQTVATEINERKQQVKEQNMQGFYSDIDESKFAVGLNAQKCKQLITWAIAGFSSQILEQVRSSSFGDVDFKRISDEFDSYLAELRKAFYR